MKHPLFASAAWLLSWLLSWLLWLTPVCGAQDAPLWGALAPGPYPVGFESRWEHDASRVYDTALPDGTRYAAGKAPRPILVNVWYPAEIEGDSTPEPMLHGGYLELRSSEPPLARLSIALADYARGVIVEWMLDRTPATLDEWDEQELDRFLASPTACVRDARAAPGPFPLVLYHGGYGSSYEDNSVLCEYLASHGYVVVSSAFQDELGGSFNIDGKDGSGRDFAFLIHTLSSAPNVDWERVAVAGHSGGAHASLGFQAEPMAAVDAVVSLDTTQDYVSALDPHWRHPRKMLDNVEHQTAPLLVVADAHAFFQVCDAMVHTDRYYLTFGDLEHNDYTSQGVFRAEIDARRAEEQSAADAAELRARASVVRTGFEQCSGYVRLFLDAYLKDSSAALEELKTRYRTTPLAGVDPHVEFAAKGAGCAPPYDAQSGLAPTPRQLLPLVAAVGGDEAVEILTSSHAQLPDAPIFEAGFAYAILYDLVARGRVDDARALAPFYRGLHPDLVSHYLAWLGRSEGERYAGYRLHALTAANLVDPENEVVSQSLEELRGGD